MNRPVVLLGAVPAGLLAAVLMAGCSGSASAPYRATTGTCYAFAVQALERHVTVTTVPRACAGLSHEQIDLAVTRAIRAVVGPHSKVAGRRLAHRELPYLVHLIKAAPVPAPAPLTAPSARPSSAAPLRLAALAAWVATMLAGSWLLAGWLVRGGLRRRRSRGGVPPAVIVSHFTLALAGLGVWIAFVVTGVAAVAWVAVGVILSIAGLGMATLAGGLPGAADAGPDSPGPAPARTTVRQVPVREAPALEAPALEALAPEGPAREATVRVGKPVTLIVVHGALAAATILLVVLAAIGPG
jgi:manganese efflux pump family protein